MKQFFSNSNHFTTCQKSICHFLGRDCQDFCCRGFFVSAIVIGKKGTKGISCTRNKAMMESKELWFTSVSSTETHAAAAVYTTHAIPFRKKHVHMVDGSEIGINMDTQLPARREFRIKKKASQKIEMGRLSRWPGDPA